MDIHLDNQTGPCFMWTDLCFYHLSVFLGYPWSSLYNRHYFSACVRGKF